MDQLIERNEELLKEMYLEQLEDYCNVTFPRDNLPGGIALAVNELIQTDPNQYRIASEKLDSMSMTYATDGGIPAYIKAWIAPYRRPHLVGDKRKRLYNDGT